MLFAKFADLDQIHQVLDFFFDGFQTHQRVQFFHQLVKIRFFRLLLFGFGTAFSAAGSLHLFLVFVDKARLAAGDIVQRIQSFPGFPHARRVADRRQAIGALGDILRLGIGNVVVHRRQIQQDIGQHADKGPGCLGFALGVVLRQVPEKDRRQKHLVLTDRTCQVPEQPFRLRAAAGIDLVCHLHMALTDFARAAPECKGGSGHEVVHLRSQRVAGDTVKGVGIGKINFMEVFRASGPGSRHGILPPYFSVFFDLSIICQVLPSVKKGT